VVGNGAQGGHVRELCQATVGFSKGLRNSRVFVP
jgi:hypothetical protein